MTPKKSHPWKKPFQDEVANIQVNDDLEHDWLIDEDGVDCLPIVRDEDIVATYNNIAYGIYEEELEE